MKLVSELKGYRKHMTQDQEQRFMRALSRFLTPGSRGSSMLSQMTPRILTNSSTSPSAAAAPWTAAATSPSAAKSYSKLLPFVDAHKSLMRKNMTQEPLELFCPWPAWVLVMLLHFRKWLSVGEDAPIYGASRRRAHRGSERSGSVVRPQDGYNPEILSHLSLLRVRTL